MGESFPPSGIPDDDGGSAPRILIFDLLRHAHLPTYLQYLVEGWCRRDRQGWLDIVVHPHFAQQHKDIWDMADAAPRRNVRFHTLSSGQVRTKKAHEDRVMRSPEGRQRLGFADFMGESTPLREALSYDWTLFCEYARSLQADHAVIVHIDSFLPLMACGFAPPCPLSGIYFAPTFHYTDGEREAISDRDKAIELRQKFVLARALRQPLLHRLFVLDPHAVRAAEAFPSANKIVWLPDPVRRITVCDQRVDALRASLRVESGRKVLLKFGHLTPRKGLGVLLEAVRLLPESVARTLCLVLCGTISGEYRATLERAVTQLRAQSSAQIVTRFGYVPKEEVPVFFQASDCVLTVYPRHPGMSGIVLLAAAAGRPVLSSSYGLMGATVRDYRLGPTVDANDPSAVATGLTRMLTEPADRLGDPQGMRELADAHDDTEFARVLFDALTTEP